jgi:hypothetical protein
MITETNIQWTALEARGATGRRLVVDHDHSTGMLRGMLCDRCNSGLGAIERPGFVDAALAYLKRSN